MATSDPNPLTRKALIQLIDDVGYPSGHVLKEHAGRLGLSLSSSTVYDLRKFSRKLQWSTISAVVLACEKYHRLQRGRRVEHQRMVEAGRFITSKNGDIHELYKQETGKVGTPDILVKDWNPLDLGVHQVRGGGQLPAYLVRDHDAVLRAALDPEMPGCRLLVLIGNNSTGKTRACREAVLEMLPLWRLEYPRTVAALDALLEAQIPPRTVMWLNELRDYAGTATGQNALDKLVDRMDQLSSVVILTSVWWHDFSQLGGLEPKQIGQPDPFASSRILLRPLPFLTSAATAAAVTRGGLVEVPDAFGSDDLRAILDQDDPLLIEAVTTAQRDGTPGKITQHLAAGPDLERFYRCDREVTALIEAAMDATRLGNTRLLSPELITHAADGYLEPALRATNNPNWVGNTFKKAIVELRGAVRPLSPVPPSRGTGVAGYQLADALDQLGRTDRAGIYPPASFWEAYASTTTDPELLRNLGLEARWRGRYQRAISMYCLAADRGDSMAWSMLVSMRNDARDPAGAEKLAQQAAAQGITAPLRSLAERRWTSDKASVRALLEQAARLGDHHALAELGRLAEEEHDYGKAVRLYRRAAKAGSGYALGNLAKLRSGEGHHGEARSLAVQAADHGNPWALLHLALSSDREGRPLEATSLAILAVQRGADSALHRLGLAREDEAGDFTGAEEAYRLASDHGDAHGLFCLAILREEVHQDAAGADELLHQAADLRSVDALIALAERAEQAGDTNTADTLITRSVKLGYPDSPRELAAGIEEEDPDRAEHLLQQAARAGCNYSWFDLALRTSAGDHAGTEAVCLEAANRGLENLGPYALKALATLWEQAGAYADAHRLRRFGLHENATSETGQPGNTWIAAGWDFGSYGGYVADKTCSASPATRPRP